MAPANPLPSPLEARSHLYTTVAVRSSAYIRREPRAGGSSLLARPWDRLRVLNLTPLGSRNN
ncbi:uncharacterized protein G2W53_026165 [Senna tora]|uniref:Uncharacterized protein n=1 Tax=Senna tora TaxID=362788 RepID=A0A834TF73_9FABA|nr:uncharacterized protein G2W53_026165 [Senna tora]